MGKVISSKLDKLYRWLDEFYGDLGWWPADTDFEIMVGAILTQNTAWSNVETAIEALRSEEALSPEAITNMKNAKLERLIRPSGFFRQKAERLKTFSSFLIEECGGDIAKLRRKNKDLLRARLMSIKGVGEETADSILLYALKKPVFVVDAYTKRVFSRHSICPEIIKYSELQGLLHENFPMEIEKLNRYHSYIVETAKRFCKRTGPRCEECPLNKDKG